MEKKRKKILIIKAIVREGSIARIKTTVALNYLNLKYYLRKYIN